jgi:hypothetical protein
VFIRVSGILVTIPVNLDTFFTRAERNIIKLERMGIVCVWLGLACGVRLGVLGLVWDCFRYFSHHG